MSNSERKRRFDMSREEKACMASQMKRNSTDEHLKKLLDEWNRDPQNIVRDRQIQLKALRNIRNGLPRFADAGDFWNSVKEDVTAEMEKEGASVRWEPFKGSKEEKIDHLDAEKIPIITEAQLRTLHFDFEQEKFHRPDSEGRFDASDASLRHEFRNHFETKGLVYAGIKDFMSRDDKKYIDDNIENWEPSCATGPWDVVAEAIRKDGPQIRKVLGGVISDHTEFRDGRFNPDMEFLLARFPEGPVNVALRNVMDVGEALYRSVGLLMMTDSRTNSRRSKYSFNQDMHTTGMSFLSCLPVRRGRQVRLPNGAIVQLEHIDDHMIGAGALWGLVAGQYVIVWLYSYEMNVELERIHKFRGDVMEKKPADWTEEAFWNLVASVHLEKSGFTTERCPTPVKIPLEVGKLLLFDFKVIHSGMPSMPDEGAASMRGHMYWAQTASRRGYHASKYTRWPWDTSHEFFPGWDFIAKTRSRFV